MSEFTPIEWCDSTVNPVTGCDGCELWNGDDVRQCYAGEIHENRLAKSLPQFYGQKFSEVRLAPGRMAKAAKWSDMAGKDRPDKPWLNGLPRHVFISDMSDALSKNVPLDYLMKEVIGTVKHWPHIGMWLTKQPGRMVRLWNMMERAAEPWPKNLYPMTSITSMRTIGRISELRAVGGPGTIRGLSIEPILEPIRISCWDGISFCIVGGESGTNARPCDLTWVRSIRDQCVAAAVRFFFKQAGSLPVEPNLKRCVCGEPSSVCDRHGLRRDLVYSIKDRKGGNPSEWPADLRVRQMPVTK